MENNGLATKDIHFDMVTTLEDFAPDLSIMKKWATEFGSPMSWNCHHGRKHWLFSRYFDRWGVIGYESNSRPYCDIPWGIWEYSAQWTCHDDFFCSVDVTSSNTCDQKCITLIILRENLTLFDADADPADLLKRFLSQDEGWFLL